MWATDGPTASNDVGGGDMLQGRGELPSGWVEAIDSNGYPYFAHPETGASQWERPAPSPLDVSSNYAMGRKSSPGARVLRVDVVCPEGIGEGHRVLVEHSGQSFQATVPQGLSAGDTFQVELLLAPGPELQSEEISQAKHGSAHGRSMWTAEEDRLINEGVCRFGPKWRQIATAFMPSRSDSSIRNRWMRMEKEKTERQKDGCLNEGGLQKQAELAQPSQGSHDSVGKLPGPLDRPVQAQAVRPLEGCFPEQLLLRSNEHSNEVLQPVFRNSHAPSGPAARSYLQHQVSGFAAPRASSAPFSE